MHRRRGGGEGIPGDDSGRGSLRCSDSTEGRLLREIVLGEHEADHEILRGEERRRFGGETIVRDVDRSIPEFGEKRSLCEWPPLVSSPRSSPFLRSIRSSHPRREQDLRILPRGSRHGRVNGETGLPALWNGPGAVVVPDVRMILGRSEICTPALSPSSHLEEGRLAMGFPFTRMTSGLLGSILAIALFMALVSINSVPSARSADSIPSVSAVDDSPALSNPCDAAVTPQVGDASFDLAAPNEQDENRSDSTCRPTNFTHHEAPEDS